MDRRPPYDGAYLGSRYDDWKREEEVWAIKKAFDTGLNAWEIRLNPIIPDWDQS